MIDSWTGRPRLYIGSSPEGKVVAEAIKLILDGEIVAEVWSHGTFGLSHAARESVDRVSREFDFAALVVTPDDVAAVPGARQATARDNVIFEAGLFTGRLGPERTFLVCPREGVVRLPAELGALTEIRYGATDRRPIEVALAPAAARLRAAIRRFKEYRPVLRPADVVAEELGRPLLARPRRASAIGTAVLQGPRQFLRIANISASGALLESTHELPVGRILDLDLALDGGATIRVAAKVVRVQYPDWGRVGGVGVAFTALAPEARARLEKFVEGEREAA